jgi:hypothetical protein
MTTSSNLCLTLVGVAILAAVSVPSANAQSPSPSREALESAYGERPYSPYAGREFPTQTQVFWGDTHVHTAYSFDAGSFGARLDPSDAYRFAKGQEVVSSTGQRVKLSRPLDFLVVADHSDNMGFFPRLNAGDSRFLADPTGRRWYDMIQGGEGVDVAMEAIAGFSDGTFPPALQSLPGDPAFKAAWQVALDAAEEANDPGAFTAFIGYEWTSNTNGNNLHRVVVFRDDADRAGQVEPYTTLRPLGSDDPRDLWRWLGSYEQKTGGQVLAIPHNGNLSNGIMFPLVDSFTGQDLDREYAATRIRWEPLYEVTQIKGDGETHPLLSPDDEFADYETWDKANLTLTVPKEPEMLPYEYGRSGLQMGLQLEQELGINPYKFGMIGSTDTHTALATADEDNFFGKHSGTEPNEGRIDHPMGQFGDMVYEGWSMVASGYAGVWAKENTREAIFDAMVRKEVYATTGPRMLVRLFGGWDFQPRDAETRSPAIAGYQKGVPMGGTLHAARAGEVPTFLVAALKDPIGANLDRIQIVKGWLDSSGERREQVYDVALSDGRQVGSDGKAPPVGNTVDVANASWTNTIGDTELIAVWEDPDFDPGLPAFYYARVLQIPTPRWTAYDARYYSVSAGDEVPMTTQDRAYTSPIWYAP